MLREFQVSKITGTLQIHRLINITFPLSVLAGTNVSDWNFGVI